MDTLTPEITKRKFKRREATDPYVEGWTARAKAMEAGHRERKCPYLFGSEKEVLWNDGWDDYDPS